MSGLPDFAELQAKSQRVSVEFLMADIELCRTFVALAETELGLGEREAAENVLGKAEDGYAAVNRLLPHISEDRKRDDIAHHLHGLRAALDQMGNRLRAS